MVRLHLTLNVQWECEPISQQGTLDSSNWYSSGALAIFKSLLDLADRYHEVTRGSSVKISVSRATARNSAIEIPAWRNWSRRQQAPTIMALSFTHSSFDFPFGFANPCVRDASQLRAINHSRFHRSEVRLSFRRFLFYFRFATSVSDIVLIAFIIPGAFIKNVTLLQRGSLFSRLACEWSLPRCNENLSLVKPPSIRFHSR